MKFDVNALINTLPVIGTGMLGIFIVTAVIVSVIYILNKVTR